MPQPDHLITAPTAPSTASPHAEGDHRPPHPYPGWQPTHGFDPHDPVHADGAHLAFGHWFDDVPVMPPARLTAMQQELDVGEQVVGSDHIFRLPLPFNQAVHVGAALTEVKVDGNAAFSARLERNTLEESGSMTGEQTGEQLDHPIIVRFTPTERGASHAVLTFRATWADARVEEQRVRLVGRARELNDAPTRSLGAIAGEYAEASRVKDERARDEARYADPSWRNAHTADGPRADFDVATQAARRAAQKIAAQQNLGLSALEKQVGTFKAATKHQPFWMDLAELAVSIATAGVADVVGKKLALAIGTALIDRASDKAPLVSGLSGIIKEQVKSGGHAAINALKHERTSQDVSAGESIEFFEKQGRALILLQDENAKIVDERAKYLQPVLSTNPTVATQTMTALADSFEEASTDAVDIQKSASAAQWLAYRARLANGTQEIGRETVTDLDHARPSHPSSAPAALIGVIDLSVDLTSGLRVRSAYARGIAQAAASNLTTVKLASARVPLRLIVDGNSPEPAIITRDEAGRVRVSGDLSKLSSFNAGEGSPATEVQAERAAEAICEAVLERTLADRGIEITTDDHSGRAA